MQSLLIQFFIIMISRRLLRIKALQTLYAYKTSDKGDLKNSEKELLFSIEKSYDLYHLLLLLIIDLANYAQSRIDIARAKYFPTQEEANPNLRFVDNLVIVQLRNSSALDRYVSVRKVSWSNEEELIKRLYRDLLEWEVYQKYMEYDHDDPDYQQDRKFVIQMISEFLIDHEMLHQVLEEQSIYWNDDLEFVASMVIKTLERSKADKAPILLSMFKNEDDRDFVIKLLRKTVLHGDSFEDLIKEYTQNWDFERLAMMDILIMQLAITEVTEFKSIPVKVTLNEFIEIAKYYSTEKSNVFINGILDKIFEKLQKEKKISKTGRGLMQ